MIRVRGARVHNLRNVTVEIPHNAITVVTGVSGSGKSSLAFDTIYAEGQRRYVESLSAYARQFLERMEKPDVDEISGIAPAVAIRQKNSTRNPRSTVATSTEPHPRRKPCGNPLRKFKSAASTGFIRTAAYTSFPLRNPFSTSTLRSLFTCLSTAWQ